METIINSKILAKANHRINLRYNSMQKCIWLAG